MNNIKIVTPDSTSQQIKYTFDSTAKVSDSEQRLLDTNEALKAKIKESEEYISQLEGIIDGQN